MRKANRSNAISRCSRSIACLTKSHWRGRGAIGPRPRPTGTSGARSHRLKGLLDRKSISRKEYDDATSTQALSQAAVNVTEAAVRQAELDLSHTTVTAPVAGIRAGGKVGR